jgi:hypothetical protein
MFLPQFVFWMCMLLAVIVFVLVMIAVGSWLVVPGHGG